MHSVYWTGPVSPRNLDSVRWAAPTEVIVVNKGVCSGSDTKCVSWTSFNDLAKSLPGNKLQALDVAASAPGPFSSRTLCGFSAGGALLEALLADPKTAPSIDCVLGLDCFYFQGDPAGFWAYAKRAAAGKALMVLTTSGSADAGYLTPSEAVKPFVQKLGAATLSDQAAADLLAGFAPRPQVVQQIGGFYHFGFGSAVGHVAQATRVGPAVLQSLISPRMAALAPGGPPAASSGSRWLQAFAGLLLGAGAIVVPVVLSKAVERRRRSGYSF